MGGRGSGRHPDPRAKATTDTFRAVDIHPLQRERLLASERDFDVRWLWGDRLLACIRVRTEAARLILTYRHRLFAVRLDWTACNYGGRRTWLLCPRCGRRVATLFFRGAETFACRRCHRLAYQCQREQADEHAARRANRIRALRGWKPGILNGEGERPKRMRREIFERLCYRASVFGLVALDGCRRRLGLGGSR